MQCDGITAVGQLHPAGEDEADLDTVDAGSGSHRQRGVELVALERALPVEVEPRSEIGCLRTDPQRDEDGERRGDRGELGPAKPEGRHEPGRRDHCIGSEPRVRGACHAVSRRSASTPSVAGVGTSSRISRTTSSPLLR